MRIGELAKHSGVSERMLRYYEQQGLLEPNRTQAGYRDYGPVQLLAAVRIRQLNESGLKLSAIRILLPCMRGDAPASFVHCDEIRQVLSQELLQLDSKLAALNASREMVAAYLHTLEAAEA